MRAIPPTEGRPNPHSLARAMMPEPDTRRTPIRLAYFVDSMEVGGSELNAIRTLEHLDRTRFDLTVFHMGSQGPLLKRYRALGVPLVPVSMRSFKHLSAVNRVHSAGTLPNFPNPHGLLDISVLPSTTEGFPNTVVEAMAAGCALVATAVGGTPEAVEEGRTALIPPGEPEILMRSLETLITSPEQRRVFGVAGRERARAVYHADVVLERLTGWYASPLAAPRWNRRTKG